MPLHERRTVFVKIDGGRGNGIFGVGTIREFATALEDFTRAVCLYHCLQQELDNFWMQVAANQHLGGGSYEWHVGGRDVSVNINYTLRQYQPNELREYNCESLCVWKAHEPDAGISQQGTVGRCIRRTVGP